MFFIKTVNYFLKTQITEWLIAINRVYRLLLSRFNFCLRDFRTLILGKNASWVRYTDITRVGKNHLCARLDACFHFGTELKVANSDGHKQQARVKVSGGKNPLTRFCRHHKAGGGSLQSLRYCSVKLPTTLPKVALSSVQKRNRTV